MIYDTAIVGGGPAGVSAGIYAARKQLKTIFITKNFEGQSSVSTGIQNWIGEIDIPGMDLARKMRDHLLAYACDIVDISEGANAESITKIKDTEGKDIFEIKAGDKTFQAKTVLISTGSYRRKLDVPGSKEFDNKGIVYCASCDGPLFAGQDVVVVGGGNAAFETSAQLLSYCKSVTLLNRSTEFRADPVTIERIRKNPKMTIITNAVLSEVKGDKFVSSVTYTDTTTNETKELPVTGVFVEIGLIPNTDFIKNIVELNSYGQVVVDHKTRLTKTPGIWAAGDCSDSLYHQNNIAAGEGVTAIEDIYVTLHTK